MSKPLMLASEQALAQCLRVARKAIHAGDFAGADKWLRLAERHWRLSELVSAESQRGAVERRQKWLDKQARRS